MVATNLYRRTFSCLLCSFPTRHHGCLCDCILYPVGPCPCGVSTSSSLWLLLTAPSHPCCSLSYSFPSLPLAWVWVWRLLGAGLALPRFCRLSWALGRVQQLLCAVGDWGSSGQGQRPLWAQGHLCLDPSETFPLYPVIRPRACSPLLVRLGSTSPRQKTWSNIWTKWGS